MGYSGRGFMSSEMFYKDKHGVYHPTKANYLRGHEMQHISGFDWYRGLLGDSVSVTHVFPKYDPVCSFCNPRSWRCQRFLFRLRANPKKAFHVLFDKF